MKTPEHQTIRRGIARAVALAALVPAAAALAQPGSQPGSQPGDDLSQPAADAAPAREARSFEFSSPAIEQFAQRLTGAWTSAQPVETRSGDAVPVSVFISPIEIEGLQDTLYLEAAPTDRPNEPSRQTVLHLREAPNGGIRVRTYEFGTQALRDIVRGAWALPEPVPLAEASSLIPTMDIRFQGGQGGNLVGETLHPYPTNIGGAENMTSRIEISGDRLLLADRGLDMQGNVVWGPAEGERGYAFEKSEFPITREDREGGLVVIDIGSSGSPELEAGDNFLAHYAGWTQENGLFDSSYTRGQPLPGQIPAEGQPGRLIQGWLEGMKGAELDTRRYLIIPSELGYGPQGQPRAGIEPNATLFFAVDLQEIRKPNGQTIREGEPTPPRPEEQGAEGEQSGG